MKRQHSCRILNSHRMGRYDTSEGFSLVEMLLVVGILAVVITGLMRLFIHCSVLSEMSGNKTLVLGEAQATMEEIRDHDYNSIVTDYSLGGDPGNTFDLTHLNGKGIIYIDSTNADLLEIKIVVSWENKYNRVIGEDANLNGVLDAGEDLNTSGELDSIATIVSYIARR